MPLWLVNVKRWTRVVQYGAISVEATDIDQARAVAKSDVASGAPVDWGPLDMTNRKPGVIKFTEVEILAEGDEDIKESF